jgi:pyrimidine operon attenuation protein/uracil phosphoribosyltransferase
MKKSLLNEKLALKDKVSILDYEKYIKAVEVFCEDMKTSYDLESGEIGILGIARGGLPLLVSISHGTGIRKISMIQLQVSNSNDCFDFGNVRVMGECIDENIKKFIVFEDIIYKGKSTNAAINILKDMGKEIVAVYSLVIDEGFKDIEIENDDVPIKYAYEVNKDVWTYFFWETDVNKIG